MKTLIVAPAWVGDAVLSHPLLRRLADDTPGGVMDVLAPAWVAPVYTRMPEVRTIMDSPFPHGALAVNARFALARTLAGRGYARAVVLPNSLKSALIPFFAGIPERIGFVGEARYGLLNRRHRLDKIQLPLMVERFAQLAQAPGTPLRRPLPPPQLQASPVGQAAALARLGLTRPPRLAILCPGAEFGPAKRWPEAHYAVLAQSLEAAGFVVWLAGSPKDSEIGEAISRLAPTVINLCGQSTLAEAIDLIALADVVVCNDSGLMHIAAALARPLVAVFGSSSPAFTPPLTAVARVVRSGIACSPCFKRNCPLGHLRCLNELSPGQVFSETQAALAQSSP